MAGKCIYDKGREVFVDRTLQCRLYDSFIGIDVSYEGTGCEISLTFDEAKEMCHEILKHIDSVSKDQSEEIQLHTSGDDNGGAYHATDGYEYKNRERI